MGLSEFTEWLGGRLRAWSADDTVVADYVVGLLSAHEGDVGEDSEAAEALGEMLPDLLPPGEDPKRALEDILKEWAACTGSPTSSGTDSAAPVADRLVELLGRPAPTASRSKNYTPEEKRVRESILAQYGRLEVEEGDEEVDDNIGRNTNAAIVSAAAKERREQAKLESQRKREKDKEDREKQKQVREEKKEKRKTQKGERKR